LWHHYSRGCVVWKELSPQSLSQSRQLVHSFLRKDASKHSEKIIIGPDSVFAQKMFDENECALVLFISVAARR